MYKKTLFIIPPAGGKTRLIVPEIIKKSKESEKTVFWFTDEDNIEYSGMSDMGIQTIHADQWEYCSFDNGNIYQILCANAVKGLYATIEEIIKLIHSVADNINTVIVIDSAKNIFGSKIVEILSEKHAANIYLLFDTMDQVYDCISGYSVENLEYKAKKFLDKSRKEYHVYRNNREFWLENMGVEKVKRKKGDPEDTPRTRPLPTYQPYDIFGCTLYHYKQGCLPGMDIEEMVEDIRRQ